MRKRVVKGCLVLGVCLLCLYVAYPYLMAYFASQRTVDVLPTAPIASHYDGETSNISEWDYLTADTSLLPDYAIGTITCEAIGLDTVILEGDTEELLKLGAGTMKPNQEVGKGNYALAGHNMNNRHLLFGSLRYAEVGMTVTVTAYDKQATYTITTIQTVSPNAGYLIEDTEGEGLLTLVTCNDTGSQRVILRGEVTPSHN